MLIRKQQTWLCRDEFLEYFGRCMPDYLHVLSLWQYAVDAPHEHIAKRELNGKLYVYVYVPLYN